MVLAVAVMAPMTRPESTGTYSMVSGSSSAPTGPQPRGRPRPAHRLHRHRRRRHMRQSPRVCRRRDPGVDVAPAGRGRDVEDAVAAEPDRTQLRLPAPGEQRASRQQNRRGGALARADGQRKWHRASAGAESTESGRRGSRHRACACSMCTSNVHRPRARSGRAGRSCSACVAGGTPVDGALKRLVLVTK